MRIQGGACEECWESAGGNYERYKKQLERHGSHEDRETFADLRTRLTAAESRVAALVEAVRVVVDGDYVAMMKVCPFRRESDGWKWREEEFEHVGDYESDARHVYPDREQIETQFLRAVLATVSSVPTQEKGDTQ